MRSIRFFATALILAGSFFASPAYAACGYSFSSFSNGDPANAAQVMGNFNYILNCAQFTGNVSIRTAPSAWASPFDSAIDIGPVGAFATIQSSNVFDMQNNMFYDGSNYIRKTSGYAQMYRMAGGDFQWWQASAGSAGSIASLSQKMTLDFSGNLAILGRMSIAGGTDNSGATLNINPPSGTSFLTLVDHGTSTFSIGNGGGSGSAIGVDNGDIQFNTGITWTSNPYNNGTTRLIIKNGGNVGVGTTSPNQKLDVAGTIRQSNCTTAGTLSTNASGDIICTSDARLKNVLGEYVDGLKAITQIVPKRFTYKPTATNPVETFVHAGFIAQNVKRAIPQAVAFQRSGYLSLDTTAILAASVNAIKELKAANDRQASELVRLRAQNVAVLGQLQDVRNRFSALERSIVVHAAENHFATQHKMGL